MVALNIKDESKCASTTSGALYAMITGMTMTLLWSADSWVILPWVSLASSLEDPCSFSVYLFHAGAENLPVFVSFGGSGPIHLDEVRCTGSEQRLIDCRYNSNHDCFHFEDAHVRCLPANSKS